MPAALRGITRRSLDYELLPCLPVANKVTGLKSLSLVSPITL